MRHKIRITDPRGMVSPDVNVGPYTMPLYPAGPNRFETETFFCVDPMWEEWPELPAEEQILEVPSAGLSIRYNPEIEIVQGGGLRRATEKQIEYAQTVTDVVKEMENANWAGGGYSPDYKGVFGHEVHKRVQERLKDVDRWICGALIDPNTKRIIKINAQHGQAGLIQIDYICLKPGYTVKERDILNLEMVEDVYELKTSGDGELEPDQEERYRRIFGDRPIQTTTTARVWRKSGGWTDNKRFQVGKVAGVLWKVTSKASAATGAAVCVWAVVNPMGTERAAAAVVTAMENLSESHGTPAEMADMVDLQIAMSAFIEPFCLGETEVATGATIYAMMIAYGWGGEV
jgi:hypothetical protein